MFRSTGLITGFSSNVSGCLGLGATLHGDRVQKYLGMFRAFITRGLVL